MPIINLPKIGPVRVPDNISNEEFQGLLQKVATKYGFELPKTDYGYLGSFTKGVSRGATRMGETFGDILPALGASALGFEDYAQRQMAEAAETERQLAEENPAQFQSYKEVGGPGEAAKYALETIGEVTPDIASMMIPGGIGGKIAQKGAAKLAEKELAAITPGLIESGATAEELAHVAGRVGAEALAKRKAVGRGVGVYLGSYAMNAPEVFQSIYQDSGQLAPAASILFGSVSAALDSVLPSTLLSKLSPVEKTAITGKILESSGMRPGLARNITKGAMQGVATEGLTEGAQEAINIAAEGFVNQNRDMWGSEDFNRIVESSIRGGIGGGAFGGIGGVAQNAQEKAAQTELQNKQLAEINAERQRQADIAAAAQQEQQARDEVASRRAAGDLGVQGALFPEEAGPVRPEVEPTVAPQQVPAGQKALFGETGKPTPEALASVKLGALQQKEAEKAAAAAQKQAFEELAPKEFDIMQNVRMQQTGLSPSSKLQQLLSQATEFGPKGKPAPAKTIEGPAEKATPEEAPSNVITDKTLKDLGIGATAILRKNKVLEGLDTTKQEDVDRIHTALDAYLDNPKLSGAIAKKVDAFKQSLPPSSTEVIKQPEAKAETMEAAEEVAPAKPQLTAEEVTETSADQLTKENVPKVAAEFISNFIKDSVKTDLDTEGVMAKAQGRNELEELETKHIQNNINKRALIEDVVTPIRLVNLLREALDLRDTIDESTGKTNVSRIADLEKAITEYGGDLPAIYEQLKSAPRSRSVTFFDQVNAQAKEALSDLVKDAREKAYPRSALSKAKDIRRVVVEETENKNDLSNLLEKRKRELGISKSKSVKEAAKILMSEIDKAIGKYGRAFMMQETPPDVLKALTQLIEAIVQDGIRSLKDAVARIRAELGENIFRTINKKDIATIFNEQLKQNKPEVKDTSAQLKKEISIVDNVLDSLPEPDSTIVDGALNAMSNVPDSLRRGAFGFFSLPNMIELYGQKFPTLKNLLVAIEKRGAKSTQYREEVSNLVREGSALIKSLSPEMITKFNNITLELTRLKLDPRKESDANNPVVKQFKALPKDLQDYAIKLANKYKKFGDDYIEFVTNSIPQKAGREYLTLVEKMRNKFESSRIPFYLPLLRHGEYWVSFKDKNGERVVFARESQRELDMLVDAIKKAGGTEITPYTKVSQITHKSAPPTGFMAEIVKDLQVAKVSDEVINGIYQSYLSLFPAESLKQHFQPRKGEKGFDTDIVQGFAAVGSRMAHQLSNLEYAQDIGNAINGVREAYEAEPTMLNRDIYENIKDQEQFLANPSPAPWASRLSHFSYFWYITGNVSSAVVNLSQLPIVVYSVLGGKYGWGKTYSAMTKAIGMYFKGGKDNNSDYLPDWTFGTNASGEYADLYKQAVDRSAIRRGVGYDLTEMRKVHAEDYTGVRAKVEHVLGYLFQNSERFNREVTLIAAYDLARSSGMSKEQAIEEALRVNTAAHSHSLADAGPRYFQNDIGKVMFTFKRFAQAQIALLGMLSRQALKGESAEVRAIARKQLTGIFGMAYMFAGVQGMPLYGAAELVASAFNAALGDDDEPFDMAESVRETIGDLGYKGPVNQLFNADIASRTGFNGMVWRDDPRRLAEVGPVVYTIEHLMGPAYSAFMNAGRAYDQFKKGQNERAVESLMPSFIKNGMKGVRYASEGALNSKGVPIVEDISGYNSLMQIFGFSPATLSEAYARAGSKKEAEKFIQGRRDALLDALYLAKTNGDFEGVVDINDKINTFNMTHPQPGIRITESTKKRSFDGRQAAIKDSVDGVHLNPKYKQYLIDKYGS